MDLGKRPCLKVWCVTGSASTTEERGDGIIQYGKHRTKGISPGRKK